VNLSTRVLVQGITGTHGSFHSRLMKAYGTEIVAGTSPGKGGSSVLDIPVFDTVIEAQEKHPANASIVFVPAPFAAEAALEAIEGGIKTIVIITEHIPVSDMVDLYTYAQRAGAIIVGPNTPGIITPGECKLGIMPSQVFKKGKVGIVSRSGTLTYEISNALTVAGIGQSTCLGIGGDPITGLNFVDALEMFRDDPRTSSVVLIGEIGGNMEEYAAEFVSREHYPKPLCGFIAGRTAPMGKKMGHAGAIIMGKSGTAETKIAAFRAAGIRVAEKPSEVAKMLSEVEI
jgi:succinyl-CoA synthetase alpha subunit